MKFGSIVASLNYELGFADLNDDSTMNDKIKTKTSQVSLLICLERRSYYPFYSIIRLYLYNNPGSPFLENLAFLIRLIVGSIEK